MSDCKNCEFEYAYRSLFNKRASRIQDLQKKLWEEMSRRAMPGAYMQLVSDKILEYGCAEVSDLKKQVEHLREEMVGLEAIRITNEEEGLTPHELRVAAEVERDNLVAQVEWLKWLLKQVRHNLGPSRSSLNDYEVGDWDALTLAIESTAEEAPEVFKQIMGGN